MDPAPGAAHIDCVSPYSALHHLIIAPWSGGVHPSLTVDELAARLPVNKSCLASVVDRLHINEYMRGGISTSLSESRADCKEGESRIRTAS